MSNVIKVGDVVLVTSRKDPYLGQVIGERQDGDFLVKEFKEVETIQEMRQPDPDAHRDESWVQADQMRKLTRTGRTL